MNYIRAKKGLGQHFLTDKNIARKIVNALIPDNRNSVVEVGPGTGILTGYLIPEVNRHFYAIELDKEAYHFLLSRFPEQQQQFIHADILKFPFDTLKTPVAVIGNFPYFISSQIFFKILENRQKISQVVCMIQKEVADRLVAPPGNKTYGILSVFLQAYFQIEYLFTVSEKCFSPPPKVKSAVIRLIRNQIDELNCEPDLFFRIVKAGFNQRRKILNNSLQSLALTLPAENQLLKKRPEQLTVMEFVTLTQKIQALNTD
jgi:16S rRNA (adenine1518-N6/adenine1519-N6)-dimethyltransferase